MDHRVFPEHLIGSIYINIVVFLKYCKSDRGNKQPLTLNIFLVGERGDGGLYYGGAKNVI